MKFNTTAIAVSFALSAISVQATAQNNGSGQNQQQNQSMPQQQKSQDFSKKELKNYVKLQEKIDKIRKEYVSKIESVENDNDKKAFELQQEFQSKLVNVIEGQGMSVREYNAIHVAYHSNKEVQDKVDNLKVSE